MWGLRQKYLSLNGEEQDTFMISHMQLDQDHIARASSMQVEYYLALSMQNAELLLRFLIALVT